MRHQRWNDVCRKSFKSCQGGPKSKLTSRANEDFALDMARDILQSMSVIFGLFCWRRHCMMQRLYGHVSPATFPLPRCQLSLLFQEAWTSRSLRCGHCRSCCGSIFTCNFNGYGNKPMPNMPINKYALHICKL